ncbi:MAG TPA: fumarylacetoacetate hydrolase family protein [Solirubrobacteraceae bacterium]|nr:fumarylacetoacetate hydrolase family protein [Solirubrobacteraceae bacterium]
MPLPEPSKVIGVDLNYRSRAVQRGGLPGQPSYFLKPTTSISAGGELVQPQGTELACYEGQIAIVIGTAARAVELDAAGAHIGWYAAANDFGVHDFRWADRGSNLLAKGQDGFTPIGEWLPADGVDPAQLRIRTVVNGELRQDTQGDELLFTPQQLVADLSRFMTLERGDVILAGTPAGTGQVAPGDSVEVSLEIPGVGTSVVSSSIVQADQPLREFGAMPRVTPEAVAFVHGTTPTRPATLSAQATMALNEVSTATLTVQLNRRGLRSTFLPGLRVSRPDLRMVGYARTLRYVAIRDDVRESMRAHGEDAQKRVVESIVASDVLVMEAREVADCGTIGDILAARALALGGAGIVTDGGIRDAPGVAALAIPAYFTAANASSLWTSHIPIDIDVPITCAGVLVMPGDVLVGDAEGVVVLPCALAEEIAHDALEVERREAFALERVRAGESFRGLYPLSTAREQDYKDWLGRRGEGE